MLIVTTAYRFRFLPVMFDFYPGGFAALFVNSFQTGYKQYINVQAQCALRLRTRNRHTRARESVSN